MKIEDFRPTRCDIELLLVSPEAALLTVSQLMCNARVTNGACPTCRLSGTGRARSSPIGNGSTIGAWVTNTPGVSC